jgi:LDH2 family malate/lactate/ureidoglycolate dehydrogenase
MAGGGEMAEESGQLFPADFLEQMTTRVLVGLGAAPAQARLVATSLVLSNLVGHDSHGVIRLLQYSSFIDRGQVKPTECAEVARRRGAVAAVDGRWGFGQPAAQLAARLAMDISAASGVAAVTVDRCNHVGRLGEYVAAMAGAGKVGMAWCNSGPVVAPFGGAGRVMGTNPLAWAVPRAGGPSIVVDFATSSVAEGKLVLARAAGQAVAPGLIIDAAGRATTDPNDFYDGGALLPFGGHKGSGLSVMIELAGGVLSGMGASPMPDYAGGNGTVLVALDIDAFMPLPEYLEKAARFWAEAKRKGAGLLDAEVLMPGEVEDRARAVRMSGGIPVPDEVRRRISDLAAKVGVDLGDFAVL